MGERWDAALTSDLQEQAKSACGIALSEMNAGQRPEINVTVAYGYTFPSTRSALLNPGTFLCRLVLHGGSDAADLEIAIDENPRSERVGVLGLGPNQHSTVAVRAASDCRDVIAQWLKGYVTSAPFVEVAEESRSDASPAFPDDLYPECYSVDGPFGLWDTPFGPAFKTHVVDGSVPASEAILLVLGTVASMTGAAELDAFVADAVDAGGSIPADDAQTIRHALAGALFHLRAFAELEVSRARTYISEGALLTGVATRHFEPGLVFQAEASIIQMRAALDAVANAISSEAGWKGHLSYGDLRSRLRRWDDARAAPALAHIENSKEGHARLEEVRNRIAHPKATHQDVGFGSFTVLPLLSSDRKALVVPPIYEPPARLAKYELTDLEKWTRTHVSELVGSVWP